MWDVLLILTRLSESLQATNTIIADVHRCLEATLLSLTKLKSRDGPKCRHLATLTVSGTFHGQHLTTAKSNMGNVKEGVLKSLIDCLNGCFSDVSQGVVSAAMVACLPLWPSKHQMTDFGDSEVATLVDAFVPVLSNAEVCPDLVEAEWTELKYALYDSPVMPQLQSWPDIFKSLAPKYPNIMAIIELLLVLPAHTADCERGFSLMKQTKTDFRSCLGHNKLSDLLFIKLHCGDIDSFDPDEAIDLWNANIHGKRSRRHDTKPYGPQKCVDGNNKSEENDSEDVEELSCQDDEIEDDHSDDEDIPVTSVEELQKLVDETD